MSKKSDAVRTILDDLTPTTNVTVTLTTQANDQGNADDYLFTSWQVDVFLYDTGDTHPDATVDGLVKIGSATALILADAWDAAAVAENLDDHSQWYANIGKMLTPEDRPGLAGLFESYDEEVLACRAPDLLIIPELNLDKPWQGRRLSLEVVNAITKAVGRHCAFTVIDPEIYDDNGRDEEATRHLVTTVESAGFSRWYATSLFIRTNLEGAPAVNVAEPEVRAPYRFELSYAGLGIAAILPAGVADSSFRTVGVPLPRGLNDAQHLFPAELGPFTVSASTMDPLTLTIALPDSESYVTVGVGADGEPVVSGAVKPDVITLIEPWAASVYEDCVRCAPAVDSAVRATIRLWLDGAPTAEPKPGQAAARVPWLPRPQSGEWVAGGDPVVDYRPGSRSTIAHVVPGAEPVDVGEFFVENLSVIAELNPDLTWSKEDRDAAAGWMHAISTRELSVTLIATSIVSAVYSHVTGGPMEPVFS